MTVCEDHSGRKLSVRFAPVVGTAPGDHRAAGRLQRDENGQLLALLEGDFDILLTADKNLRYQQNLKGRRLSIIELPTNRLPLLRPLQARIVAAIDSCQPSSYLVVDA